MGVRGQFCGRCLEIRYGEDCAEVQEYRTRLTELDLTDEILSGVDEPNMGVSTVQGFLQLLHMQVGSLP